MSSTKPSLPKGTRDFGPVHMAGREMIFGTIKGIFKKYGFSPIETPSMENLSVLTGKYGDEGDQLIFKILNSGDFFAGVDTTSNLTSKSLIPLISEKALRYDLTVPFARYVVMNRNEITFPFKRFQIQPVWRADRPQKGRYREFYQCDADVVGTDSLICEAEIILMIQEVLSNLGIKNITIKINNRKILSGIAEVIGAEGKEADICVAIDKLDKIGKEGVVKELLDRGIVNDSIQKLLPLLFLTGKNLSKLDELERSLSGSALGMVGVNELREVFRLLKDLGEDIPSLEIDLSLARGLSYYTGAIIEVKANDVQMGSISGGGRYDNLTGLFGLDGVSGVGISFGVDRIYDVMHELGLFVDVSVTSSKVMITNFDAESQAYSLKILTHLRKAGIASEIYPKSDKIKKQFGYADAKKIPFVVVIGEDEMRSNELTLKNLFTGQQKKCTLEQLLTELRNA